MYVNLWCRPVWHHARTCCRYEVVRRSAPRWHIAAAGECDRGRLFRSSNCREHQLTAVESIISVQYNHFGCHERLFAACDVLSRTGAEGRADKPPDQRGYWDSWVVSIWRYQPPMRQGSPELQNSLQLPPQQQLRHSRRPARWLWPQFGDGRPDLAVQLGGGERPQTFRLQG
jgi:hypothetical protein